MKTCGHSRRRAAAGYALLMVLVVCGLGLLLVGASMQRTSNISLLNERNNQYFATINAAEAATEKVIARMRWDYVNGADAAVNGNLNLYRTSVPTSAENAYWSNFEFSDGQGNRHRTYVQCISNRTYVPMQSQFHGLYGWRTVYRIVSNARQVNGRFPLTAGVQQEVETDSIPVFQFAIFYNSLLEFTWAAPLTVRGRTHANGPIFVGSICPLQFDATVTTTRYITKTNWAGCTLSQYTGSITYNGNPGYRTNVPVLALPIGTNNTPEAVREIINLPPAGEDVNSPMGKQRYFNKASVVLLVSNATVRAVIKNAPDDAAPAVLSASTNAADLAAKFPFLSVTNTFTDQRENKTVKATQIDVDKYNRWLQTNATVAAKFPAGSGTWPNVAYVADLRTVSSSQLAAVRLVNGASIPTNGHTGFTLATPNPLYVWGHYNAPVTAHRGTTNTSATQPASLISDALTILSPNWLDSQSAGSFTTRRAVSTTVNAALLTGVVYSTGPARSQFSGGVQNMPRLLEDWGNGSASIVLTLNTAMVNFFNSARATNQFQWPGNYYYAPTRNFNFDMNFTDPTKLPPGTPMLQAILRSKWTVPPPNTVTYAGY